MTRFLATFFYTGLMRPAPGTWGSLATLPFAYALYAVGGLSLVIAATVTVCALGYWVTQAELKTSQDPDPSEIVIDEVAGMLIALVPVFIGATHAGASALALWPGWVTAFAAFRLFDIWKPGPIGWADRQGGAFGVMLDDIFAGLAAACCVMAGAALTHGVFEL